MGVETIGALALGAAGFDASLGATLIFGAVSVNAIVGTTTLLGESVPLSPFVHGGDDDSR
jgi:hypothetical protein